MKRISFVAIGLAIVLLGRAYCYDNHDFQVWNTDVEEFQLNKKLKGTLEEEFRWGDNASEFFYQHYDAGLSYTLNKYWHMGGGYRHVLELKKGSFKAENEPYLTATLFLGKNGFDFDSRSRLEYRHFAYQADAWRYRNKFTLKLPWKFTAIEIRPFLSDELLFGFGSANQLNQNRFYSGLSMGLAKHVKGEIYYLLVSTRDGGKWNDANVLGTKLKLSF
ncbi:MAG: DUF2490 domain-containing protein [Candidatus Omnitrophota bacterium]|nr:DUF2490 domain-containing protein [Candidatus Omnitrophota bacterium]